MTFSSRYDSDGTGKFMVGDIARVVTLTEADFNAVAHLLNEAYRLGQENNAREFLSIMTKQWAEEA